MHVKIKEGFDCLNMTDQYVWLTISDKIIISNENQPALTHKFTNWKVFSVELNSVIQQATWNNTRFRKRKIPGKKFGSKNMFENFVLRFSKNKISDN